MIYFVFSDIHGCFDTLMNGLMEAGYELTNPNHHLLFLGDGFDKNRQDYDTYVFLRDNLVQRKCTWVLGNHDVYLLNCLRKKETNRFCKSTIHNIAVGINPKRRDEIRTLLDAGVVELLSQGRNYFETPHYVFTHGMIPFDKDNCRFDPNWRSASMKSWNHFRNVNGMRCVFDGVHVPGKTLVVGHIGSYYGHLASRHKELPRDGEEFKKLGNKLKGNAKQYLDYFDIYHGDGVIGVDCRCFDTGIVHILVIED